MNRYVLGSLIQEILLPLFVVFLEALERKKLSNRTWLLKEGTTCNHLKNINNHSQTIEYRLKQAVIMSKSRDAFYGGTLSIKVNLKLSRKEIKELRH